MTDVIADMLTRIRNGQRVLKEKVSAPHSREKESILRVLKDEGYIRDYHSTVSEDGKKNLIIELKYYEGSPVIQKVSRCSRPGLRSYSKIRDLPFVSGGLGIYVLSTSRGVLSDVEARKIGVGGEVICSIF